MDFRQPISYLFPAIIITMAGVLVFKIYKKGKGRIRFSCILFIIYIEILMQTAFFSREPGSRQQIDLNLFGTWGQTAIAHAYFIENLKEEVMNKRKNNNSPLKIAVLGHKTIPSRQGEIEIVVEELTVRMAKLGHKITV